MEPLRNQAQRGAFTFVPPAAVYVPSSDQAAPSRNQSLPELEPELRPQSQPVPQLHAIFPLGSNQIEARKYTAEDWDVHRPEITRLYENNTLNIVIESMRQKHGLDAT